MKFLPISVALVLSVPVFGMWTASTIPFAHARISPEQNSTVHGKVEFAQTEDELLLKLSLSELPAGRHAIYIYESENCTGAHFNPTGSAHGGPEAKVRHVGDLGNIESDTTKSLRTVISVPTPRAKNFKGWTTIAAHSFGIHERIDDPKAQPNGAAGAVIGCGKIVSN